MKQNLSYRYLMVMIMAMFTISIALGQADILNQYIYKSDQDSIKVSDYLDPRHNELLLVIPNDCSECYSEIIAYEQNIQDWEDDYALEITILVQPIQWQFTTSSLIEQVAFNTDLEVMVLKDESVMDRTYLISQALSYNEHYSDYLSTEDLTAELEDLLDSEAISSHVLEANTLQCSVEISDCEGQDTSYTYVKDRIQLDDQEYAQVLTPNSSYRLRLDQIQPSVIYYDEPDSVEHMLYPLHGYVCDPIQIYSITEDAYIDGYITAYEKIGDDEYWTTDIPFQCDSEESWLILSTQYGTNAGLLPFFENGKAISQLICHYDRGVLDYGDEDVCPIDKVDQLSQLKIYPNPVADMLFVNSGNRSIEGLSLHNVRGQVVIPFGVYSEPLDLSGLPAGIYFLSVTTDGSFTRHKIIKY